MKRVLYILGVFFVSLLLVMSMLVAVLMSDRVQTSAVQWVTNEFAQALGTNAHIGEVHYHFPARVSIHDVYIEDLHHDTLAYVDEVYVHFKPLALMRNEIRFSHVNVRNVVAKVYQRDGEWNYQFLIHGLGLDRPSESEPIKQLVAVNDITLDSVRVQYEDYEMSLVHASLDLNEFTNSTLDAQIADMALSICDKTDSTQKPFDLLNFNARLIRNDTLLSMPTLRAELANSTLDLSGIEVHVPNSDTMSIMDAAHNTTFSLRLNEARVVPSDLSFFMPQLNGIRHPIAAQGELGGMLDSLYFQDISLAYNGNPVLCGDVCAIGLPDVENTYVRANLSEVQTNASRLQDFLSQWNNKPVSLPSGLHRLGTIRYHGLVKGKIHDLMLHGGFRTALGAISTQGKLVSDSSFAHMRFDARVEGRNFRIGRLLDNPQLRSMSLSMRAKGTIDEGRINGDINACVNQFIYNDYTFSDLHFEGNYQPEQFVGHCYMDDPHANLDFEGVVNLKEINPEINFNLLCRHFDLSPFSSDHDPILRTSFAMAIDMNGAQMEEISGYAVMDSLWMETKYDSILIQQISLVASAESDQAKSISIHSDNLQVQVDGVFRYADLMPSLQSMLHTYLPTVVRSPGTNWSPVSMSVRAEGGRLRAIQRLFEAPVTISDHTSFAADLELSPHLNARSPKPFIDMRFFAPGVRLNNTPVHDLLITLNTVDTMTSTVMNNGLNLALSAEVNETNLTFSTLAFRDTMMTRLAFDHMQQVICDTMTNLTDKEKNALLLAKYRNGNYKGDIRFITHFSQYAKKPLIEMHFLPADFVLRDSVYQLSESQFTYCAAETSLQVDHFSLSGAGQHLRVNGMASAFPTDTLTVDMQRLDASYVVPFVIPKKTILFNGLMTGKADVTGLFGTPLVEALIHIDQFGLNNCWFGDADVDLHVYPERQRNDTILPPELIFHAEVDRPERHVVSLDGNANFVSGQWGLDMIADSVPLAFVNHWTSTVIDSLEGNGSGRIRVGSYQLGAEKAVYVLLNTLAQNASLTLPWTGARYQIANDSILMDTTSILFPNVHLTDMYNNPVEIDGSIHHVNFKKFKLDLHVDAHDALVFDSNVPGDMMQGSVFATGHVDVTGNDKDILVAANARTSHKSHFRFSIDTESSANESNFIHFVQHPELDTVVVQETDLDNIDIKRKVKRSTFYIPNGRCLLKLNLDVTPQLLFELMLGERNGDLIKARGSGGLSLTYDTQTGDVSLLGTYDMQQGTMSYTVANVIRKEFTVGAGSTIIFSGDASNPQLDVTAKYRVTASLKDLFGEDIGQLATSRTNIPVLTCLHLTGPLSNPLLNFALEFPMSDQSVQQQVRQIINTDEMLMRQVIYLLVFGRFFTPDYMNNSQYATLNSTYSLLSSTVTGQINAWLSKLTNMLTLGVAIRTDGEGASASQEYEAQFQLQPVDRLVINGNFGYRYNDISNQPFFGDLDVEVLLTEDGQWRLKGYTHTVDKYSLKQATTIQGVGILWKKDF